MSSAPETALRALAGSTAPYLIGVRHHSPALSVVIGDLLDAFRPEVLLLELPAEFAEWLPWLADEATRAPVALAGVVGVGGSPAFYPFADFSPELVAIRWAARHGVEVIPCDLPLADRQWQAALSAPAAPAAPAAPSEVDGVEGALPGASGVDGSVSGVIESGCTKPAMPDLESAASESAGVGGAVPDMSDVDGAVAGSAMEVGPVSLAGALRSSATGRAEEDMWDRVVEAKAPGTDPEAIRRAALLVGWAMRHDAATGAGVSALDLRREEWMRHCLAAVAGRRAAAVVGSFHATALLSSADSESPPAKSDPADGKSSRAGIPTTDAGSPRGGIPTTDAGSPRGGIPTTDAGSPRGGVPTTDAGASAVGVPATDAGPSGTDPRPADASSSRGHLPSGDASPSPAEVPVVGGIDGAAGSGAAVDQAPARDDVTGAPRQATAPAPVPAVAGRADGVVTSLVPYTFSLLDERSGYPAGIRDPRWQQFVVVAAGLPAGVEAAALGAVVDICARVRAAGHPAGPADAKEAYRLALDLARLRGLPAPGRGEVVEALQSALTHGEVLGRGRVVAAAMEQVLVGDVRGALAPGAPRSGLRPAVARLLAELRLPLAGDASRDLRLDPLRSDLDRRREVALRRLAVCHVPYAERVAVEGTGGADPLTSRWTVEWTPGTEAVLDVAGLRGVTLAQAAEGTLRQHRRTEVADGGPSPAQVVAGLGMAAECGLVALARERLGEVADVVPASGSLDEAMTALALVDRIRHGHVPGLPEPEGDLAGIVESLEAAAVRQVDGLAGSDAVADVHALVALAQRLDGVGVGLRLADALGRLAAGGTPVMSAAAGAVRVLLGLDDPAALGVRVGSWVDNAVGDDGRRKLLGRVSGLLAAAEPLLQTGSGVLDGLLDRVESLSDEDFLSRLPALRGGFQTASPAGRDRLLAVVEDRVGEDARATDIADVDAATLLVRLVADRAGRAAVEELGIAIAAAPSVHADVEARTPSSNDHTLSTMDRWRLLLGRRPDKLGAKAARYATALDELYGAGSGEGSRADAAGRAGREAPYPGVREWAEELAVLFGPGIREEVLARAAEGGRRDAALMLRPEAVTPSVELLQTVLSLVGAMPESAVARLRPLVARIVDELTRQLASRLRPALAGITTPRPTRRPGGQLDLARTLRANLATTRRDADGRVQVVPERPVFKTRARRGVDWRLVLVVDVSGSMEASVIWSALTGAVLAGVPALTTHFIAFSTEVVDLTDRVSDPLGLLLEVRVGGGTHIAAGLRHARSMVTVPSRTLVVVVSDFEEGYPVGGLLAETRALVESGVTVLGCASLDDAGRPRYSVSVASQLVACGMPVAALSPLELARWVGEKVRA